MDTILGANAHVTVYSAGRITETGQLIRGFEDYDPVAARVAAVPGVLRAAPVVKGQVMATANGASSGVEVFGMRQADLATIRASASGPSMWETSSVSTRASRSARAWRRSWE